MFFFVVKFLLLAHRKVVNIFLIPVSVHTVLEFDVISLLIHTKLDGGEPEVVLQ